MSFKRTLTFASAISLIAIVGVLYVSYGSQQESSSHKASVATMISNADHLQPSPCYRSCHDKNCVGSNRTKNCARDCQNECAKKAKIPSERHDQPCFYEDC